MFAVRCPEIDGRVLIFPSQVRSVSNHDDGIDLVFRCVCGGWGVWRSGMRAADEQLLRHDPPDAPAAQPSAAPSASVLCGRTA